MILTLLWHAIKAPRDEDKTPDIHSLILGYTTITSLYNALRRIKKDIFMMFLKYIYNVGVLLTRNC